MQEVGQAGSFRTSGLYLSLIECYKIVFGITDNLNFGKSSRTRANHRYKLYVKMAKVNLYKYSFFV
jgi:hypothetical protein